jgi:pimeloyl-ACP methyl ester carboxylesterase
MLKNPIIFVHGIGASGDDWKRFEIPDHDAFYITFANHFAHPAKQVRELCAFIDEVLEKTKKPKVILVCHSMGGLVARKYLADNLYSHKVEKLIMLSTPNLGTLGLSFDWMPLIMIFLGAAGLRFYPLAFLFILLGGITWEIVSYLRGVLLHSPADLAMHPHSKFLKQLNKRNLPADLEYVVILSDTNIFPHRLVNLFLFRERGDGAVPISSQRLSPKCVPNFSELNYKELKIALPHFSIPKKAGSAILQAVCC